MFRVVGSGFALASLLACGGRAEPINAVPVAPGVGPVVVPLDAPVVVDVPRQGCRSTEQPSQHPLMHVTPAVEVGERSFAIAWRRKGSDTETVIVALDGQGALVVTPVPVAPGDPVAIGGDAGGLIIISVATRGTGKLLRIALGSDDSLKAGKPIKLPEVGWGWPEAISSDGVHATLEHTVATTQQGIGGTVLYRIDLATQKVISKSPAAVRSHVHCHAGACTTLEVLRPEVAETTVHASLVRRAAGQPEEKLELELQSSCPAFYTLASGDALLIVAPGDPWRAVQVGTSPPFLREVILDATLMPIPGCPPPLHSFPSPTRPGVTVAGSSPRSLLRWDPAAASFGASEPLPAAGSMKSLQASHPDGVVEVSWSSGAGMMHSPTDAQGTRRYFRHWSFDGGQVSLLRHEHGQWVARDTVALPVANAEGTFDDGYAPIVLRHGLHSAVLLVPDGPGDPAWFQPYLAPCASP